MTNRMEERRLRAVPREPQRNRDRFVRAPQGDQTWCQANSHIYLSLERPPGRNAAKTKVDAYDRYTTMAREWCANRCPLFAECLQEALAGPGIDGFVAGTTEMERKRLRETMGIVQTTLSMDRFAGTSPPKRSVQNGKGYDLSIVAEAVAEDPDASHEVLAERLGISAATVKRHRKKLMAQAPEAGKKVKEATPEPVQDPSPDALVATFRQMFLSAS